MMAPELLESPMNTTQPRLQELPEEKHMFDRMSDLVRDLRRELKMTQEEFAHALGITVGTVNRWENGRFRPSKLARATLFEFASKRGLSLETLAQKAGNDPAATTHH